MKKLNFVKMSGSGNDFVVVDDRRKSFPLQKQGLIPKLCNRHEGVGADGLLLLRPSERADFRMLYFNADGSRASMCGNGARCIAWYARRLGIVGKSFKFETDAGVVGGHVVSNVVEITMSEPFDYRPHLAVRAAGKTYPVVSINTGVPHAIVFVRRADAVNIREEGRALRYHKIFGAAGTNVNFVERLSETRLRVRTYERGVEDETLACGTGVCASAIAAGLLGQVSVPVECLTSGGDILEVRYTPRPGDRMRPASDVRLKGPVRVTFEGETQLQ